MSVDPAQLCAPAPGLLAFLERIGLAWELTDLVEPTLLPGLSIRGGRLLVDGARLAHPGDILHEAGHIAVTAAADRPALGPAGLDIAPEVVFHEGGYKGAAAHILAAFGDGATLGQPLLEWMGLCATGPGEPGYPAMKRWLRA